jgi:CTP-dependent riboflavin kinase
VWTPYWRKRYHHFVDGRALTVRGICMSLILELLQSSGPIALNELNMRVSESAEDLLRSLEELKKGGAIVVTGPKAGNLLQLTPEEVSQSSDTVIELSRSSLRRQLA